MMLEVKEMSVQYGMIQAVKQIGFSVEVGEVVSLIGANGAGKTTTLKTISGLLRPTEGEILFKGRPIQAETAKKIVQQGVSHVPEGRHVFSGMSILENLQMGAYLRKDRAEVTKDMKNVFSHFPVLEERKQQDAATLSGGEQQMLAMGRALMSRPELLMLDEPSMGLAPLFIERIFSMIKDINKEGTTVLLIEQNAKAALQVAHRGYVLETGKVLETGSGQDLLNSETVRKAYLGV